MRKLIACAAAAVALNCSAEPSLAEMIVGIAAQHGRQVTVEDAEKTIDIVEAATGSPVTNLLQLIQEVRKTKAYDNTTADGRRRWHGACSNYLDQASMTMISTYEDGFVWRERATHRDIPPAVRQLTAAEREAKRLERARRIEEAKVRARLERIASIQTNFEAEVQLMMQQKDYPEELARLMLQWEFNKLVGTNVVNAIVTPEGR